MSSEKFDEFLSYIRPVTERRKRVISSGIAQSLSKDFGLIASLTPSENSFGFAGADVTACRQEWR
jgi:hypothetical protein